MCKAATREGRKGGFFLNNQVGEDGEQAELSFNDNIALEKHN